MSREQLTQFSNQKYLNLESYRKDGKPVLTPMWFAEDSRVLYVYTLVHAGKVKRIRNNPRVRVVPCDVRGTPKGTWVDGKARIVDTPEEEKRGHALLDKKYGWLKKIANFYSGLIMKRARVVITIRVD
jgi:hypothetical protein